MRPKIGDEGRASGRCFNGPRSTRYVSEFRSALERNLFLEMVQRDLWSFFATLAFCRNARAILIADSVTGKYYMNEFLQRFAPAHRYSFDPRFRGAKHPGKGKTCRHYLSRNGRKIPVYFCSSSPSDRACCLAERVARDKQAITSAAETGEWAPCQCSQ